MFFVPAAGRFRAAWWIFPMVSVIVKAAVHEYLSWTREEVDAKLHQIMVGIHATCVTYGKEADGHINYVKGANIGGFVKVADAMMAQGLV